MVDDQASTPWLPFHGIAWGSPKGVSTGKVIPFRPARRIPTMESPADPLVGLMVEYQAGRLEAFEALYGELVGDLRRHFDAAMRGGVASDLVQETFMEM